MNLPNDPFTRNNQHEANYVRLDSNSPSPMYPPQQNYFQQQFNPNIYVPPQSQSLFHQQANPQYIPIPQPNLPQNFQYNPASLQNDFQTGNLQRVPSQKLAEKIKIMALTAIVQNCVIIFFLFTFQFNLLKGAYGFIYSCIGLCVLESSIFYCLWKRKLSGGKATYKSYLSFRRAILSEVIIISVLAGILCFIAIVIQFYDNSYDNNYLKAIFLAFAVIITLITLAFLLPRIIVLCVCKKHLNLPQILRAQYRNQVLMNAILT